MKTGGSVSLYSKFKIDTEDELDLTGFNDQEDISLQASTLLLLFCRGKARDQIMQ